MNQYFAVYDQMGITHVTCADQFDSVLTINESLALKVLFGWGCLLLEMVY